MIIYTSIPFRTDKSLFKAYDDFFEVIENDDYLAITDHDVMFTSNDWLEIIEQGIKETGGVFFTGYCNRVACRWQVPVDCPKTDDYSQHRDFWLSDHYLEEKQPGHKFAIDRTGRALLSGFFMVIKKSHWNMMRPMITVREGCLGLDNELHEITRTLQEKIWQLPIYFYHWYRGGSNDKSHLL